MKLNRITEMPKVGDILYYKPDKNTVRKIAVIPKPKDVSSENIIGICFLDTGEKDIIICRFHDGMNIFLFKDDETI